MRIKAKVNTYTVLRHVFSESFGFMLNRIADVYENCPDWHGDPSLRTIAEDRCWNEFSIALDEADVELIDERFSEE